MVFISILGGQCSSDLMWYLLKKIPLLYEISNTGPYVRVGLNMYILFKKQIWRWVIKLEAVGFYISPN